jgi:hypothetical protein
VRGWPLLLCAVLFIWQPLNFAAGAAAAIPTLGMRGIPGLAELLWHGLAAAVSVAAGVALWKASPAGPALARAAVVALTLAGVQSRYWSVLPSNVFPSDRPFLALAITAHGAAWLLYLHRSKRIRALGDA